MAAQADNRESISVFIDGGLETNEIALELCTIIYNKIKSQISTEQLRKTTKEGNNLLWVTPITPESSFWSISITPEHIDDNKTLHKVRDAINNAYDVFEISVSLPKSRLIIKFQSGAVKHSVTERKEIVDEKGNPKPFSIVETSYPNETKVVIVNSNNQPSGEEMYRTNKYGIIWRRHWLDGVKDGIEEKYFFLRTFLDPQNALKPYITKWWIGGKEYTEQQYMERLSMTAKETPLLQPLVNIVGKYV